MRRIHLIPTFCSIVIVSVVAWSGFVNAAEAPMSAEALAERFSKLAEEQGVPNTYDEKVRENGITELYLDGPSYQGKATRVFALYRAPTNPVPLPSGKIPAVVLVHGGGGSAFEEWVEKWNSEGFAAISIAVEGQTDTKKEGKGKNKWARHAHAGPARPGIYADTEKPIHQQWMYHAVSAVIRARNFLESKPEIDRENIGVAGISWGGVITSTTMGFDSDFAFAIPIYGCGFLDTMDNQYKRALWDDEVYREYWEPANRISNFSHPSLWLTWRDDRHFSLDAQAQTYLKLEGDYAVSIKPDIGHSHVKGWSPPESYQFAKHVVTHGVPWVKPMDAALTSSGSAQAQFHFDLPLDEYQIVGASVHYSKKTGHTSDGEWVQGPAEFGLYMARPNTYIAIYDELPSDVTRWFINVQVRIHHKGEAGETYTVSSRVLIN